MKIKTFLFTGLLVMLSYHAYGAAPAITCNDSVKSLGKTGAFEATCPANCTTGSVWGSQVYTTDSKICKAAIHSGAIPATGGEIKVTLIAGQPSYTGSNQNGITTNKWGSYGQSFTVSKVEGTMKVACTDSVKGLGKAGAAPFSVVCPSGCTSGSVWGSKTYTADSKICKAAIHAGVIGASGGMVKVKAQPGQASYVGTTQNGVTTSKWGSYGQGFTVSK